MSMSQSDVTTLDRSHDRGRSDAASLLDAVLTDIRREGLGDVLTACYLPRSGTIRVAGVGTAVEHGLLVYGIDYPADASTVDLIRRNLAAFARRRAGSGR
jgi:hypothetical protein